METYEIMRVMGTHIFDLHLHDVFLPTHTIEQNKFDILGIVRNIPQFVTEYKYNILSQRFLEVTGEGKIISCISIQQLSDSIRTHGLGILSTTVNAFYKFLVTYLYFYSAKSQLSTNFCLMTKFKILCRRIESGSKNIRINKITLVTILMKEHNIFIKKSKKLENLKTI